MGKKDDVNKLLCTADSGMETELIRGVLENEGIPSFSKDRETGGYMRVYMGVSSYGEDIYVNEAQYETAKQVLLEFQEGRIVGVEEIEEESLEELEGMKELERRQKRKTMVAKAIALIFALGLLGGALSMIFNIFK